MRGQAGTMKAGGEIAGRLASFFLRAVYPSRCPVCGGDSDTHPTSPLCGDCWRGISRREGPACGICARPLNSTLADTCGECLKKRPPFIKAFSFGLYEGALRETVHLLKFQGIKRLAESLGALLAELDLPAVDAVVPVPLSLGSLRERGFNQALLIGRPLAASLQMEFRAWVLEKKKDTPPQVSLTRSERLINLRGAFRAREELKGERILLVDDVITTGATVAECSRALLKAGAGEVYVAALCRA